MNDIIYLKPKKHRNVKPKYYGTYTTCCLAPSVIGGTKSEYRECRVVCKATSMDEANRIAKSFGFNYNVFTQAYTTPTGNKEEIKACDEFTFIVDISVVGSGRYVSASEALLVEK